MSVVRLLVNTNKGRKGELVDDPDGHLVKGRLALPIGSARVEEPVVEEAVETEEVADDSEASESDSGPEDSGESSSKNFKRSGRS